MNGATAVCEYPREVWAAGAFSDELAPAGRHTCQGFPKVVENVPVTFDDVGEHSPRGGIEKRVYRLIPQQAGLDGRSYVRGFRAESSHFSCAAEANTAVSSGWLLLRTRSEVDPNTWRGVFAIQHQHRELFSQRVELNLGTLPRWKPQITITRRMLDTDDE